MTFPCTRLATDQSSLQKKKIVPRTHRLIPSSLLLNRALLPYISSPSFRASILAPEDTRIRWPISQTRCALKAVIPRPAQRARPLASRIIFPDYISLEMHIGPFDPLSYVIFVLVIPLSIPAFSVFYLSFLPSHNAPASSSPRLALGYDPPNCLQLGNPYLLPTSPRGSATSKATYTFPSFPLIFILYSLRA